jgi:aspartyl-tRNA(Asn)/glutamyl-tRNA(Gln) amidotransferase subunit B
MEFETVLGLEVHAQLKTHSKLFCPCPNRQDEEPNVNVCPICLGLPGVLPVLNRQAVELALRLGLATGCSVRPQSRFARKNYFYPDLPKGYQISQYDEPVCERGGLPIELDDGELRRIGITRIHMEEDAGKLLHDETGQPLSRVDFNRGGVPLLEIVSEPELRSAAEARAYLQKLRSYLRYLDVSDADMEKGQFRCDVNISLRPRGSQTLGTRVEIKNVNSFRFVVQAIEHEQTRQARALRQGTPVVQETRLFDAAKGVTASMRSKEEAHDYRYFPDPDLVPLAIAEAWVERVRGALAELPDARRERFVRELGLSDYTAAQLVRERELADYFEATLLHRAAPVPMANWILTELLRETRSEDGFAPPLPPDRLAGLLGLLERGTISGKMAKDVFAEMLASGEAAEQVVERKGLALLSDRGAIERLIEEILTEHRPSVEQYLSGKTKLFGFFVGQAMKKSGGQADPGAVNELLREALQRRASPRGV